MTGILERGLITLQNQFNLIEIVIPFILVFVVIFAVLTKAKIFDNKKVNVMIAFVMGLVVIFQHYYFRGPGRSVVEIMNDALPQVTIVVIAIVMVLIILGIFGNQFTLGNNPISGWIMFLAIAIVVYIFGSSAGIGLWNLPYWLRNTDEIIGIVVAVLVFALVIGWVTKEDDGNNNNKRTVGEFFSDLIKSGDSGKNK
ncbi:MAG: hypothetical protein ACMXYF_02005 [Candidatus Woesearchaeota archaeon]